MFMAVFGAVAGNFNALSAILGTIEEEGIHTIACTGNLIAGHGMDNSVLDLVVHHKIHCVQGVHDRLLVRFLRKAPQLKQRLDQDVYQALARAHAEIGGTQREYLQKLPRQQTLFIDNTETLLCHGAPSSQNTVLTRETPLNRFQREREIAPVDIIVCGGASEAFSIQIGATLFVGPPPVSMVPGTASFGIINTEEDPWTFEVHSVSY